MAEAYVDVMVELAGETVPAGRLWSHRGRGTESATFRYGEDYLGRRDAYRLDPTLELDGAPQQTPDGHAMFRAFSDCAPDGWGRRLIQRDESRRARRAQSTERSFGEIDYLLGVRDDMRQGALRFWDPNNDQFLAPEDEGVPPLRELPRLLHAADRLERDSATDEDLRALLRGGSSLGGARPKAHVRDRSGRASIAKFPSPSKDSWDVMRWEAVAMRLAEAAGITVASSQLHVIDDKPVLIVDRFDRVGGQRVGYVSALTMLEANDGEQRSYLEIAEVIEMESANAGQDLHELWRRMAFSVLISNTDDHLRNHGFLRTSTSGWSLSPAFDLNPNPSPGPKRLSTAISGTAVDARIDLLMEVAEYFRLNERDAREVLGAVSASVVRWKDVAEAEGLDTHAIEQMQPAFEHDQAAEAQKLRAV